MYKLVIIGSGGHTEACIDVIEAENKYKIIGIIEKHKTGSNKFLNYPILATDKDLKKIKKKCKNAFISIGQIKNSIIREKKLTK